VSTPAWLIEANPKLKARYGSGPTYPQIYVAILSGRLSASRIGKRYQIDLDEAAKVFELTGEKVSA